MRQVMWSTRRVRAMQAVTLAAALAIAGCGRLMAMMHDGPSRPADSEFGFGPRASSRALYTATIEPTAPLRQRKLQMLKLRLLDTEQEPVDGAVIAVDGGMPQHGHGLPTAPKVTRALGNGVYQVDGVKFNMGGWWELKFSITTAAGVDTVTFNLEL